MFLKNTERLWWLKLGLSINSIFDMNNKRTGYIFAAVALITSAAIIMGFFGILSETALLLPGSTGNNPIFEILANDMPEREADGILDPNAEVRGVWIATVNNINFPSRKGLSAAELKRELDAIVETCLSNSLNTVYFQVRPLSDALYNSEIFPSSEYLTGKQGEALNGGFDPLDYLVRVAHENGIKVHAWVNPLRVTYGTKSSPSHDVTKLAEGHPARENPEYTVAYDDGKLYFNAGIPEVRELVVSGVREIAENYDVDGIVFDDYFYPYAAYNNEVKAEFDDSDAYEKYGKGDELGDWRRNNINELVKACYDTIKEADSEMQFGISPFGIWQNDNGKNGGSATSGTEAYEELYCDALAWIEGGYVDYIAPQIYWSFTNSAARYDTLVRWWNSVCDGTGVDLLISHAAYRYADEWTDEGDEILNQIEFARSEISYRGSILYGYDVISKNTNGICDELAKAYASKIVYTDAASDGTGVSFNSPADFSTLSSLSETYLLAASDPAYPVYYDGEKLSRTKSGYFSVMLKLESGKNEFTFTQNGKDYIYTVYNGVSQSSASTGQAESYKIMDEYKIVPVKPTDDLFISSEEEVCVTVKAPANSEVICTLGDNSVKLTAASKSPGKDKLYEMVYSGTITMPSVAQGEILELGEIMVKATDGNKSASSTLAHVRVGGSGAVIPIEVTKKRTGLKISPDSYYYDDFTSQAKGMRDNAVRLENGYYLLRVGGYVAQSDVKELDDGVKIATVGTAEIKNEGDVTRIYINSDVNIPMNGRVEDGYFILNLYNVDISCVCAPVLGDNPLFDFAEYQLSTKQNCFRYHLKLKNPDNFFGFEFSYEDGKTIVNLRNPKKLSDGDTPLKGRVIVLDAGHGGNDMGASGANSTDSEAELNLRIVLAARDKLSKLGAEVVLTREDDSYVALTERMKFVEELSPDLMISVHQNSMDYNVDITKVRGLMALYWEYAGKLLSETMADSMSLALGRLNRGASTQRLAMVRCERYPSTLIEVGFMTNVEELERTSSPDGIETAAQAIADGVIEYYRRQSEN